MPELPELDPRAFGLVEAGHCSITLLTDGVFVRTPWIVPQQPLGAQNFQLHESVLKQMALIYGLVDRKPFEEVIDQRDATIEELKAVIQAQEEEMVPLRWASDRYHASEGAKNAQARRSKNEEHIARLERSLEARDAELERLKSQGKVGAGA